ncbi:hypothetical protein [Pseudoduganella violaceinigra]|uniref:hypothetical protein n=1 Tax=Pseudoduganella violaceinigra TaxID=246602 RepID=UPI0003FA3D3E|nr:hypothetical protein [Pseudoduganella violaceinigra]
MVTTKAVFFEIGSESTTSVQQLSASWFTSGKFLESTIDAMRAAGEFPNDIKYGSMEVGSLALGGEEDDRAELRPIEIRYDSATPSVAQVTMTLSSGNLRFYNGYGRQEILRQSVAGWRLEFTVAVNEFGGLVLNAALCDVDKSHLPCDNAPLKEFFITAVSHWLRTLAPAVLKKTAMRRAVIGRENFLRQYIYPMVVDKLQRRLNSLPDYVASRDGVAHVNTLDSQNEKSGVEATLKNGERARFIRNSNGWTYRDHVLLNWQEANRTLHDRESEQDLRYTVNLGRQSGPDGVSRPTLDIGGVLGRYEWDSVKQELPLSRQRSYMGKAWARATLQWSLRLQWHAEDGRVGVASLARKGMPATDAGTTGIYVVSDPLPHLLNVQRINLWWEGNAASLSSVQQDIAGSLAAATGDMFAAVAEGLAPGRKLGCRDLRINESGDIEIELGE